jgi:hypothetical protein
MIAGDGTGQNGFAGNGGLATSALLEEPVGIAVDKSGIVFIADTNNHVIGMVAINGIISTIAVTPGSSGYSDDDGQAFDAQLQLIITAGFS